MSRPSYPPMPEDVGPFKLWPPDPTREGTGWGLSWREQWLPVILHDRAACLLLMGAFLTGHAEDLMLKLNETYNRAKPPVNVTVEHIIKALEEDE